ncbi:phenylalanine--tRNA ligase subunit beta [Buchnera aphidicola]|uniref:phenylalanine--tRNA ligase subunit beta n=1 Tax=Buchnera aphidicola TaxID=9 RepID=UPI0031B8AD0A
MKFNELWIRKFINFNLTINTICKQLTKIGLESEFFLNVDTKKIIIGKIVYCFFNKKKFLYINIVDIGLNKYLKIFSKFNNCRKGIKVLIHKLPINIDSFLCKGKYFLFGEFCSFLDFGLSNDFENIIELPKIFKIGKNINKILWFLDRIVQVNIPQNRFNSIGILGIVKEIYAFHNINYIPCLKIKKYSSLCEDKIKILINSSNKSFKYYGKIIKNINLNVKTPLWIKKKLFFCNIKSYNIIDDIINYIFLEYGQVFHVFNLDNIFEYISLRLSKKKEKFIFENNKIFNFKKSYWVIADKYNILSLGSNVISKFVKINNHTRSIFVGSVNIKTVMNYKESFFLNFFNKKRIYLENTVDDNLQKYIVNYAVYIILNICGGYSSNLIKNINSNIIKYKKKIKVYIKNIYRIIGFVINIKKIYNILYNLGYNIYLEEFFLVVFPPNFRLDVNIEQDVINDILRMYGINNTPCCNFFSKYKIFNENKIYNFLFKIKSLLVFKGYYEVINYSFVEPNFQNIIHPDIKPLYLKNPISNDFSVLRVSLLSGLIKSILYNKNRQQDNIKLFESGLCFILDKKNNKIKQKFVISGIVYGNINQRHWGIENKKIDFYDLKGDLEFLFEIFKKYFSLNFSFFKKNLFFLHPKKCLKITRDGDYCGYFGTLHPLLQKKLDLNDTVNVFEFSLDYNFKKKKKYFYIPKISLFPISKRDIVILVPEQVFSKDIIKTCLEISKENITNVSIFDVYQGSFISYGKKSLAINFVFQRKNNTLKECDIVFYIEKCLFVLKKKFNAVLRNK